MKVKITFIVLKKDNITRFSNDNYLKVYLDKDYNFPSKYISTKDEYETLKEICNEHLNIEFDWIKKELFSFEVLNHAESEVTYIAVLPEILEAEKNGSFYTLSEISDIGIKLKPNYERAIFQRGRTPVTR